MKYSKVYDTTHLERYKVVFSSVEEAVYKLLSNRWANKKIDKHKNRIQRSKGERTNLIGGKKEKSLPYIKQEMTVLQREELPPRF